MRSQSSQSFCHTVCIIVELANFVRLLPHCVHHPQQAQLGEMIPAEDVCLQTNDFGRMSFPKCAAKGAHQCSHAPIIVPPVKIKS